MSPVRARRVATEPFDKLLRRARARRGGKDLAVVQPCLEVIGRRLDYHGRVEPLRLHPLDGFNGKVVDKTQTVRTRGPDVDMRVLGVLVAKPLDRLLDLDGALPFSENHLASVAPDAEVKALAAHRTKLDPHQPFD